LQCNTILSFQDSVFNFHSVKVCRAGVISATGCLERFRFRFDHQLPAVVCPCWVMTSNWPSLMMTAHTCSPLYTMARLHIETHVRMSEVGWTRIHFGGYFFWCD